MKSKVLVYRGEAIAAYGFGDPHPFGTDRHDVFHAELDKAGIGDAIAYGHPRQALADELALYTSLLNRFAADPDLGKLAAAGDWGGLKREQERIARLLPRVQRVNIFPTDWDGAGPDPRQTLSFASLEMLLQVERA